MKAFLAGVGAGFALGLVIAPQSGEETRARIAERAEDLLEQGREQARELARRGNEMLVSAREQAGNLPEKMNEAIQQGREQTKNLRPGDGVAALNSVGRDDLLAVYGIGPVLADKILSGRPYKSINDLIERGILPESTLENLKRELLNKRTA
jgi:gas vesicle protein